MTVDARHLQDALRIGQSVQGHVQVLINTDWQTVGSTATFDAPEWGMGASMMIARASALPDFGNLIGVVDNSNGSGREAAAVFTGGAARVREYSFDPDHTETLCDDCESRAQECSGCDRCGECCVCDKWYCEGCDEYCDDDVSRCDSCEYCESCCGCIRCDGCGDVEEDYCDTCGECTNGCCDCSHCVQCGHAHRSNRGGEGICAECDSCTDGCCDCDDDED